jgi:hypothetical protein
VRDELLAHAGNALEIHIVWTRVLPADTRELAATRAAELEHEGVFQYWDTERALGTMSVDVGESPLAWDVYLFFEPGATWETGGEPPAPALWSHQLRGADPRHAAYGRVKRVLAAHRRALCGSAEERTEGAVALLRQAQSVDASFVGEGGDRSETYAAYERLRDHATRERLLALTSHKSPVVRCYAVQALSERHPDIDLLPVLLAHVEDLEEVETQVGCIGMVQKTGDVMIFRTWETLTEPQRLALVEALLPSKLDERWRALVTMTFPPDWRPRLRALAEGGDDQALVALARYRNEEDLPLLVAALGRPRAMEERLDALSAASLFPDPRLFNALAGLEGLALETLRGRRPAPARGFCFAMAAQESEEAARILERLAAAEALEDWQRRLQLEMLAEAVAAHRVPAMAPVLWSLWRRGARLDAEDYRLLASLDPERARAEAERSLQAPEDLDGNAIPFLLSLLPREKQVERIAAALEQGTLQGAFAARAGEMRDPALVAPLEEALGHWNPHVYLAAAEALLAYGDAAIEERLHAAVAEHEHLRTGWGGEEMRQLLAR